MEQESVVIAKRLNKIARETKERDWPVVELYKMRVEQVERKSVKM